MPLDTPNSRNRSKSRKLSQSLLQAMNATMHKYNEDQLSRYFKHIALPSGLSTSQPSFEFLVELTKRQLSRVPFESISLHYSKHRLLSLDPDDLFEKIVGRGMGGYCMENNTFFSTILRSLGFTIMTTGARVSDATAGRPGGGYMGW